MAFGSPFVPYTFEYCFCGQCGLGVGTQKPGICMVPNQLMLLILITNKSYLLFFLIQNLNIFPFILPSPYFIVVFLVFQFHWYTAIQLYITQPYRRIGKCSNIFKNCRILSVTISLRKTPGDDTLQNIYFQA